MSGMFNLNRLFLVAFLPVLAAGTFAADGFPKKEFASPSSEYCPGYFWMWNDRLDVAKLNAQLDDMASNGVRSVCIHPFPKDFRPGKFLSGMSPDYLTPEYISVFSNVIDHIAKIGMSAWLYDEGGWPSGGACGRVVASDAEGRFRQTFFGRENHESKQPVSTWRRQYGTGRGNYPSIIEPGATERFIELTHEAYARYIGSHFGKTVRFAFTDEPDHPIGDRNGNVGWATDFAEQFSRRKGYDIMPFVPELLLQMGETLDDRLTRVRIDYHEVMGDLFVERFLLPIRSWCRSHGILSGGHLNGEDVPEFSGNYGHGALLKSLRAMDVPGVDVIWRQLYPSSYVEPGRQVPFPRYAASAAHQNGGTKVLSESFGIYGDSLTPDEMKWLVDYQMVRGVSLFVFGYYAMSYAGQWMALMEPHSGPVVPYWEFQRPFFDYVARTSSMLAQGRPTTDIAVLYDERGFRAGGIYAEMAGERHYSVSRMLDRMNCEYEFIDEEQIEEARIDGGKLVIGAMKYGTVVLPTSRWMSAAARKKLESFRAAGGKVLGPDDLAEVRPTMRIAGPLRRELRVAKRRCGVETLYFIVNESQWSGDVTLEFDEPGEVVRCDRETGSYVTTGAVGGKLDWHFPGFGSALFVVGAEADAAMPTVEGTFTNSLAVGWTVRRPAAHKVGAVDFEVVPFREDPVATELGDWRGMFGNHFSGKAVYRTSFASEKAGRMSLDLGRVCWSCGVRLNGREVGKKFFGPYRFDIDVNRGVNVLEVTVGNLLANALSDEVVRNRIARDFPPVSGYDMRQRAYDRANNESGLFGPVRIIGEARIESAGAE